KHVALAQRVAGEAARDLHHLLLIDHDAVSLGENFLHQGMVNLDRFAAVFPRDERRNHVHWTRAIESANGDDLLEDVDMELLCKILHSSRLELEHSQRTALIEEIKRGLIVERKIAP